MTDNAEDPGLYAGTPREQRIAERRDALLQAAFELIGTQGHRAATVRAVCKQAGLTDRYFYESFDNGEDLLITLFDGLVEEMKASMQTAFAAAEPELEAVCIAGVDAFLEEMSDPRKARILMMEVLGVSDAVTAHYLQRTVEFSELFLSAVQPYVPALADDNADRILLGQALLGAVIYAGGTWALSGYQYPRQQVVDHCRDVLMGTFSRY